METVKQTYVNTIQELNQQLLAMKEAYEKINTEKEDLVGELEKRSMVTAQAPIVEIIGTFFFCHYYSRL